MNTSNASAKYARNAAKAIARKAERRGEAVRGRDKIRLRRIQGNAVKAAIRGEYADQGDNYNEEN
jgi:nitrogen-specific signal transduction histidine kinase